MYADQWSDLVKQSYLQLLHFFENSAIPSVMEHYGFDKQRDIREILRWQYPDKAREGDTISLLVKLLDVSRPDISRSHTAHPLSLLLPSLDKNKTLVPVLTNRCVLKPLFSFSKSYLKV
jgi:hypothetical protein